MDVIISDNWLKDFLKTKATPQVIAKNLSLCGPSVERVIKTKESTNYLIEVTTNRVDSASHYGIAREAQVILPRFGIKTTLLPLHTKTKSKFVKKVNYLKTVVDAKLCPRFTAVLVRNIKISDSPTWMQDRLRAIDVRPINNVVDISNYIMHELGQPIHTFDYDKIKGSKMHLRESKKGEKITTLDGKEYVLYGADIVIEDGEKLIDLAGIMGGANSAITPTTKNVLLFVQTYNPVNIRRTSMNLGVRTEAASLFEKGTDPELVTTAVKRGIDLLEELTGGRAEKEILDIYPSPTKKRKIKIDYDFINKEVGIEIPRKEVDRILNSLGIVNGIIPSYRPDIEIEEDIVEEVARIYGYFNFPSQLMDGEIPSETKNPTFDFEYKVKDILKGFGGIEVYTLSLVSKEEVTGAALKLKNPLGRDSEYLRTTLKNSLIKAAGENSHEKEKYHLFEMANVYLPKKNDLPEERMTLSGLFHLENHRKAKGIIEALLLELNISFESREHDNALVYKSGNLELGKIEIISDIYIYYEFIVNNLLASQKTNKKYKEISKFPPQIEDITFTLGARVKVGEIISSVKNLGNLISNIELVDIFNDAYTFRVWYQDEKKTLNDQEVETIRNRIIREVKDKFGATLKS